MKTSNQLIVCAAAAMAGLLTLSGVGAAPLESNPVPSFNSTSGNPATDANGNQWTVCQVAYTGANDGGAWGANLSTIAGWVPMTSYENTYYGDNCNYQDAPNVSGTSYFVERNWDTGVNYNAGLIFKPDVAGTYCWSGTISWNDWGNGSNTNPLDIVFGKFDAGGTWSTLLTASVPTWFQGNLNVGTQLALQDIVLQAGDTLVVAGKAGASSDKGSWSLGSASINLTQVPEPASLALLALGGLALFRRRR